MRRLFLSMCLALVAAAATSLAFVGDSRGSGPGDAQEDTREIAGANIFLIPQTDGYGVADCIASGGECGRLVADAWCESKGYIKAASFGIADATDVTGSTAARGQARAEPPLLITCSR